MSFQDKIIEAAMSLNKEGDSVDVVPDVMKPKLFKDCQRANVALKEDGILVAWDGSKQCAVVCKGKPAPAPAPAPVSEPEPEPAPEEKGPTLFAEWNKDAKKED